MKTINVDVWDFGTGQCALVRSFTFDETNPQILIDTTVAIAALVAGLVMSDHSTDHVAYATEAPQ